MDLSSNTAHQGLDGFIEDTITSTFALILKFLVVYGSFRSFLEFALEQSQYISIGRPSVTAEGFELFGPEWLPLSVMSCYVLRGWRIVAKSGQKIVITSYSRMNDRSCLIKTIFSINFDRQVPGEQKWLTSQYAVRERSQNSRFGVNYL
jgi:hypothetical protein